MEKPKETNLVIYGTCPKCSNLVRIDIHLRTALLNEKQEEQKQEAEESAEGKKPAAGEDSAESGNVRPDSGKGKTEVPGAKAKPGDSGKTAGTKKTGGK